MPTELPEKTYFKIGEAASLVGVEPHTIRYWEKEFRAIRPSKTRSKQRLFRHKDVRLLILIRYLLHDQRFTIDGARRKLRELSASGMTVEMALDAIEAGRPLDPETQSEAAEIARVEAALAEAKGMVAERDARIAALEAADAARLQTELSRAQATCTALRDTVEALRDELDRAKSRAQTLEATNAELRGGAEIEELRDEMHARWTRLLRAANRPQRSVEVPVEGGRAERLAEERG